MTTTNEITVSEFGCRARVDSDADESLDEDEEDDNLDATPNIEQISTRSSSSNPCASGEEAATFWVEAGTANEARESLFYSLAASASDSSMLAGLFTPAFIFNVLAFIVPLPPFYPTAATFDVVASVIVLDAAKVIAFTAVIFGAAASFIAATALGATVVFGAQAIFDAAVAFDAATAFNAASASISQQPSVSQQVSTLQQASAQKSPFSS
jgi:hypothetical protein